MLPVGVHTLVHEKEQHLRLMMKMQVGKRCCHRWASAGWGVLLPPGLMCMSPLSMSSPARPPGPSYATHPHLQSTGPGRRRLLPRHVHAPLSPAALPSIPHDLLQGLSDGVYYLVMFGWHLALYCAFVAVFCTFGGLIGLRIFTLNSYSLQASGVEG